ncbi:MAG: inositol monophosphatase [Gemmataceae bacterium]
MDGTTERVLEVARQAARQAGRLLVTCRWNWSREKGRFDLQTEADLAAQETIRRLVGQAFPDHLFYGEEDPGPPEGWLERPTWVVDPLDGTTNYAHGCPLYAVSVGWVVDGEPQVGVIYDPTRDELFEAARWHGAWLAGQRLQVSEVGTLDRALIATGFPTDLQGHEHTLAVWRHFSLRTQSLRRLGSTALNLAYVAAGRFDGLWGFDFCPWDVAAGLVLVQEAGARVTRLAGTLYRLPQQDLVAANPSLLAVMLKELEHSGAPLPG